MGTSIHSDHELLDRPLYSYVEAARLARVAPATARLWLLGAAEGHGLGTMGGRLPVSPRANPDPGAGVSFLELVELAAIGELRRYRFSLPAIRQIVDTCRKLLRVDHPLASEVFKIDERDIFVQRDGVLVDVLRRRGAQAWADVLNPFLDTLDYQDQLARRWWPLGKDKAVVIDPDFGFGFPVVDGTGVRTEILYERFRAGELSDEIAADFRLEPTQVERAVQYEVERLAA